MQLQYSAEFVVVAKHVIFTLYTCTRGVGGRLCACCKEGSMVHKTKED